MYVHFSKWSDLEYFNGLGGFGVGFGCKNNWVVLGSSVNWYLNGLGFCLFDLILYAPVNNFVVMLGRAFLC